MPSECVEQSNLDTVFELGPRHVRAQVLPRPRPPRYDDFDARSAAARARGRVSGRARRAAGVEESVAVCLWKHEQIVKHNRGRY